MKDYFRAISWMIFGVTTMSGMAIGAKLIKLYTKWNVLKVAFFRSFIMAVGSYSHGKFLYGVEPFNINDEMKYMMFWRSVFGTMAFYFELIAIYLMPISLAIVLYFTQPIFASLFGWWFNGENLNKFDVVGTIFSLIGVIIVSNPQLLVGADDDSIVNDNKDYPYYSLGVLSAISGAISSASAYIWMRRIGTQVHTCLKPMYFGIFSTIMCVLIEGSIEIFTAPELSQFSMEMPAWEFFLLFGTGVCGWLAQEGVSKAISIEKAGRVAIFNYLQIVFCFLFDIIFLERQVRWSDFLGTLCIVFFTFLGSLKKCYEEGSAKNSQADIIQYVEQQEMTENGESELSVSTEYSGQTQSNNQKQIK